MIVLVSGVFVNGIQTFNWDCRDGCSMKMWYAVVISVILFLSISFLSVSVMGFDDTVNTTTVDDTVYEFTVVNGSIGSGVYIPLGSDIVYFDNGIATVTDADNNVKTFHYDSHDGLPEYIEVPSGSTITHVGDGKTVVTYENAEILEISDQSGSGFVTNKMVDNGFDKVRLPIGFNSVAPVYGAEALDIAVSWVEWADIVPLRDQTQYQYFSSTWEVPKAPIEHYEYTSTKQDGSFETRYGVFYIFNGLEGKDGHTMPTGYSGGIIQPVLAWGCGKPGTKDVTSCIGYPKDSRWTGAAIVCPTKGSDGVAVAGTRIGVSTGDVIQGTMEWTPSNRTWMVTFSDLTTGARSTAVSKGVIPNTAADIESVFAFERYSSPMALRDGTNLKFWPGDTTFTNNVLKNGNKNEIQGECVAKAYYSLESFTSNVNPYNPPVYDPKHYYVRVDGWPKVVELDTPN